MKITIIRHSIRNRGGDKLILDYASCLIGQGYQVDYWTNEVNTHFSVHPQITIKKIPIPGIAGTMLFTFFSRFPESIIMVDLVLMACLAHTRNKRRVLYVAQDYDVTYYRNNLLRRFTDFCYHLALTKFQITTVSVSEGLTTILKRYSPRQLITIPNGVDLNFYQRETNSPLKAKKKDSFVILLFAREDYRKGLDIAEQALEELVKLRPIQDWEIWTIGTAQLKASPAIKIKSFGYISVDTDLRGILSTADIYLIPSRSEGLSLLLLQALACQCAIVSTNASTIITHQIDGLISPGEDWKTLAQNCDLLMNDPALLMKLRENARKLAEKYSFEQNQKEFLKVIQTFSTQK